MVLGRWKSRFTHTQVIVSSTHTPTHTHIQPTISIFPPPPANSCIKDQVHRGGSEGRPSAGEYCRYTCASISIPGRRDGKLCEGYLLWERCLASWGMEMRLAEIKGVETVLVWGKRWRLRDGKLCERYLLFKRCLISWSMEMSLVEIKGMDIVLV